MNRSTKYALAALLAAKQATVGDRLTVVGSKGSYRDTPELMNTIYFNHEKQ